MPEIIEGKYKVLNTSKAKPWSGPISAIRSKASELRSKFTPVQVDDYDYMDMDPNIVPSAEDFLNAEPADTRRMGGRAFRFAARWGLPALTLTALASPNLTSLFHTDSAHAQGPQFSCDTTPYLTWEPQGYSLREDCNGRFTPYNFEATPLQLAAANTETTLTRALDQRWFTFSTSELRAGGPPNNDIYVTDNDILNQVRGDVATVEGRQRSEAYKFAVRNYMGGKGHGILNPDDRNSVLLYPSTVGLSPDNGAYATMGELTKDFFRSIGVPEAALDDGQITWDANGYPLTLNNEWQTGVRPTGSMSPNPVIASMPIDGGNSLYVEKSAEGPIQINYEPGATTRRGFRPANTKATVVFTPAGPTDPVAQVRVFDGTCTNAYLEYGIPVYPVPEAPEVPNIPPTPPEESTPVPQVPTPTNSPVPPTEVPATPVPATQTPDIRYVPVPPLVPAPPTDSRPNVTNNITNNNTYNSNVNNNNAEAEARARAEAEARARAQAQANVYNNINIINQQPQPPTVRPTDTPRPTPTREVVAPPTQTRVATATPPQAPTATPRQIVPPPTQAPIMYFEGESEFAKQQEPYNGQHILVYDKPFGPELPEGLTLDNAPSFADRARMGFLEYQQQALETARRGN